MLADVRARLKVLDGKLPAELLSLISKQDFKTMITSLTEQSEKAMDEGNLLLSGELEQICSFIMHRCFVADEIKEIELGRRGK
jgi:hypothetical protein